jgi:hypothetical protein
MSGPNSCSSVERTLSLFDRLADRDRPRHLGRDGSPVLPRLERGAPKALPPKATWSRMQGEWYASTGMWVRVFSDGDGRCMYGVFEKGGALLFRSHTATECFVFAERGGR